MQNKRIALTFITGLILASGHLAAAQTTPAAPPPAAPKSPQTPPQTAATPAVPRLIELHILTPDGKLIGRVTVTSLEGPLRFSANRYISIMLSDQYTKRVRLQGNVSVKTKRNGADVTLLEMNGADAVVEYTTPLSGAEQTSKAVYAPDFRPASCFLDPVGSAEPALPHTVLPFDRPGR